MCAKRVFSFRETTTRITDSQDHFEVSSGDLTNRKTFFLLLTYKQKWIYYQFLELCFVWNQSNSDTKVYSTKNLVCFELIKQRNKKSSHLKFRWWPSSSLRHLRDVLINFHENTRLRVFCFQSDLNAYLVFMNRLLQITGKGLILRNKNISRVFDSNRTSQEVEICFCNIPEN